MTVLAVADVVYRRFNGYSDPRYPEGYWMGAVSVLGDGSGGLAVTTLHLQPGSTSLSSRIFSLEALSHFNNSTTDALAALETVNLGGPTNVLSIGFRRIMALEVTAVPVFGSAIRPRDLDLLPLFLGSQLVATTTAQVALSTPNVTGITYNLEAEGYWWGSRSVLQQGGPQRPPTGIYRA